MSISRYEVEARGHADEILDLIDQGQRARAVALRHARGDEWLESPPEQVLVEALKMLKKSPAQRESAARRVLTQGDEGLRILLVARGLALVASSAMRMADDLEFVVGGSYRAGTHRAAESALRYRPSLDADAMTTFYRCV